MKSFMLDSITGPLDDDFIAKVLTACVAYNIEAEKLPLGPVKFTTSEDDFDAVRTIAIELLDEHTGCGGF